MDRTFKGTSAFECAEGDVSPGCRVWVHIPRGSFLSVTAWSDYLDHLTLFNNKYIPVWKFY